MAEGLMRSTGNGFEFNDPIFEKFLTLVLQVEPFPSCIILTSQDQPPTPALGRYQGRSYLHPLKGLTENEGLQLFHAWNLQPQNPGEIEYLQRIIRVYEGHPLALRVIAGEMGAYAYEGRIAQYWAEFGLEIEQVEQIKANPELTGANDRPNLDRYSIDLVDLVKRRIEKTVERLYVQNPLACLMLCEGAVYRRGAERSAWFTLMEEYTDDLDQHHLAFQTLQRRYLLQPETIAGGKTGYRLHSLVRRVALENMERMEAVYLPKHWA